MKYLDALVIALYVELISAKYLDLTFTKTYGTSFEDSKKRSEIHALIQKRDSNYEQIDLTYQGGFYSMDLEIGTPAQKMEVLLDTGSSDLWVMSKDNIYCSSNSKSSSTSSIDCSKYGTFDSSESSTFYANDSSFQITYGDGTMANGTWAQDVVTVNNVALSNMTFGVATRANSTVGVLGIGLEQLEVTYAGGSSNHAGGNPYTYDNFPLYLKNTGVTKSNAYSLFLNNQSADSGSILFGAVDHSKYDGQLYTVPIINTLKSKGYDQPIQIDITLQGVNLIDSDNTSQAISSTKLPALMDSGTTLTYLPSEIVDPIVEAMGASFLDSSSAYVVSCPSGVVSDSLKNQYVSFDFGGFDIRISLSDFLIQIEEDSCLVTISTNDGGSSTLGDSFLTHAYVVYDLDNLEVSMAQAVYNNTESNIEEISGSVPNAVQAAGYSSTWTSTATGNADSSNTNIKATTSTSVNVSETTSPNKTETGVVTITSETSAWGTTLVSSVSTSKSSSYEIERKNSGTQLTSHHKLVTFLFSFLTITSFIYV